MTFHEQKVLGNQPNSSQIGNQPNSSQLWLLRYHCFVVALDPAIIVLRFIGLSAAAVADSCFF